MPRLWLLHGELDERAPKSSRAAMRFIGNPSLNAHGAQSLEIKNQCASFLVARSASPVSEALGSLVPHHGPRGVKGLNWRYLVLRRPTVVFPQSCALACAQNGWRLEEDPGHLVIGQDATAHCITLCLPSAFSTALWEYTSLSAHHEVLLSGHNHHRPHGVQLET